MKLGLAGDGVTIHTFVNSLTMLRERKQTRGLMERVHVSVCVAYCQ